MERAGLSPSDLARKLRVTPTAVSSWIKGKKIPRPAQKRQLADFFNLTIEQLFDDSTGLPLDKLDIADTAGVDLNTVNQWLGKGGDDNRFVHAVKHIVELEKRIRELEEQLAETKTDRDHWRTQAKALIDIAPPTKEVADFSMKIFKEELLKSVNAANNILDAATSGIPMFSIGNLGIVAVSDTNTAVVQEDIPTPNNFYVISFVVDIGTQPPSVGEQVNGQIYNQTYFVDKTHISYTIKSGGKVGTDSKIHKFRCTKAEAYAELAANGNPTTIHLLESEDIQFCLGFAPDPVDSKLIHRA